MDWLGSVVCGVIVVGGFCGLDQLSGLAVGITGITLPNKEGKTVTLLSTTTQELVEFMPLNGGIELLKSGSALYPDPGLNDGPRDLFNKLDSVRPIQCRLVDPKRNCAMQAAPKQKRQSFGIV